MITRLQAKKKTLLILFTVIFAINLNTQAESFSAVYNGNTIYYNITSYITPRTVAVTYRGNSYNSYSNEYSGAVTIPDSVQYYGNYYSVTSIGDYAFQGCSGLTSVTIGNSVTSIGDYAFYYCVGLTSITIPNSVTSIGNWAFYYCLSLASITIPNSVTSIGNYVFSDCSGLTSITIPNSVTSISICAFSGCSGLSSITIPNSVTSIGSSAFDGCSGLSSITIPNSVTSIGDYAFLGCSGLTSINVDNNNQYYASLDGVLFTKQIDTLICCPIDKVGVVNIPNSVTSIGQYAFYGCSGLTSITIGNSVTSIGGDAFYGCSGLTSIIIPNSVTSIGDDTFKNCTSLNTVNFNAINCNTMGSSYHPVFQGCNNLSTILIGNSVTNIPSYAFSNCTGLTSITIPNYVTSIGSYAFIGCNAINTINYNAINCTNINNNFINKTSLMAINFGDRVKNIPNNAFYGCDSVVNIIIPDSVLSIGINAFRDISSLNNLKIGRSVNNIMDSAFYNCENIISIHITANNPPLIYKSTFYNVNLAVPIAVPCSSVSIYQTTAWWSSFTNYQGIRVPQFINTSICEGQIYTNYGANINSAGVYHLVSGCDSIILTLSVTPASIINYYDTICQGNLYNGYGFNFTADTTGRYTRNMQAINGCDSIIALYLTVKPTPIIPEGLDVQVRTNFIELNWLDNGSSYVIYRNNDSLTTTTMPIYLDYDIINNQPYCYKVKSTNGDCESEFSNIVCKTFLNIEDIHQTNITTKLYPNPANGITTLSVDGLDSDADITIYDIQGRILKRMKLKESEMEVNIDLTELIKGIYQIRIVNNNFNITKKLIVN
ncbi:MAG: leucine-rich repeat protein [Bacteroidales bacterium]|nr:leucine-rich repeat protein [Bacteroidales bacterium]